MQQKAEGGGREAGQAEGWLENRGILQQVEERPAVFEHDSVADLWTDEHVSSRMLAHHLDGTSDISSRHTEFIERSAAWIVARFGLGPGTSVVDLGCGPGLYTIQFARSGAEVTGVDFSERSIRYAQQEALRQNLRVEYVCGNYLAFQPSRRYDLATLIMCDFCAISPEQRGQLLARVRTLLRPNGALLFDVYSMPAFDERREQATCARDLHDGFWSSQPYLGFHYTFKYPRERVVLDKFTIVEESRTRVVHNWLQYFDQESLRRELENERFCVEELLGSVAGDPFDPLAPEFAVIARPAN